MNVQEYRQRRILFEEQQPQFRKTCARCLQPEFSCYCAHIEPFACELQFAILIHPIEVRRRIATGRMSHLTLQNSVLIDGQDFTHDKRVKNLLENPEYHPMMLYPGRTSINISPLSREERREILPSGKKPLIFVIDGTWSTARKTVAMSQNLKALPRICFSPAQPSTFRVRKQPRPECYSTIEAIHHTIELLGPACGFATETRAHDKLLKVFNAMVEKQIEYATKAGERNGGLSYRRRRSA